MKRTVAVVTLGCSRNEVDSEELAGRLAADGWILVNDVESAEVALVNTCGFIESAKKDSIDALLDANSLKGHGQTRAVVAVGCMAERYGNELAEALPDTDAILSFDDYQDISARLQSIVAGNSHIPHIPRDRRALLPIAPADRAETRESTEFSRKRLGDAPWAPLKIASGCDRRCSFCAIPYFRGSFISRRPHEVLDEARWLVANGVTELFLVSENTTSYGKDLGDLKLMEKMLPEIAALEGVERVRLSYLQPAEMRPTLIQAMIATPKTVPYFDLSFQHSSSTVLRRMRRFGDNEKFLHLINQIRVLSPEAGIRSNFIVGFPGETQEDFDELARFITEAKLDAVGIFGYSDEDNTEALKIDGKIDEEVIAQRVETLSSLADEMVSLRAQARIGETIRVLIEDAELQEGRAAHQGPEVDGSTTFIGTDFAAGQYVDAVVIESMGADLVAKPL
ncbi:MAG: 30S ribosomal protein S12 methylthiotransferase RimO [Actinobacteria bacterium]|jgi:ribosomal protein S12 methylthiotransferase RimO|nr:30S ribosomal protein S12 methylthiotransferase RimO [Actinomycetota bacterium]NCV42197.1 30S ribosomal protein S12 methylthiotransferase RimO [Actinomycetota bacterium]NCW43633.1 30S ribosomal protein S12 methylthiotransferase RimO [Actinomycetota bacterium]NCW72179.1 30S ribosomal protein S12 methylthiotransferase RimO [Actinomycetota bacterium]NDA45454.1 30S ribosomal protein S12 methylthiotransferase RimO [Actinomycetota bacterium]